MSELELLDAEILGEAPPAAGKSWPWKWLLGAAAAVGLGFYLVRDLPPGDLMPRRVPAGTRPF